MHIYIYVYTRRDALEVIQNNLGLTGNFDSEGRKKPVECGHNPSCAS